MPPVVKVEVNGLLSVIALFESSARSNSELVSNADLLLLLMLVGCVVCEDGLYSYYDCGYGYAYCIILTCKRTFILSSKSSLSCIIE